MKNTVSSHIYHLFTYYTIIPVLKDFKQQINNTNDRLIRQYQMMTRAHEDIIDYLDKLIKPSKYTI